MNDKDTIYRQAAIDAVHHAVFEFFDICEDDEESPMTEKDKMLLSLNKAISTRIQTIPTAEPERKKGKWVKKTDAVCYWYECSVCGEKSPLSIHRQEWHSLYCPHCGAEMVKGEEDE